MYLYGWMLNENVYRLKSSYACIYVVLETDAGDISKASLEGDSSTALLEGDNTVSL